jgi:hypothetical protein
VNLTQATTLASTLIAGVATTANTALTTANTALTTANNALAESNAQVTALAGSGTQAMDAGDAETLVAANAHADAGDATTLASANTHADAGDASTLSAANAFTTNAVGALSDSFDTFRNDVNHEFDMQDRRISKIGAMGGAMSNMAMGAAALVGENRVGFGGGLLSGQSAFAVGFQHVFNSGHANLGLSGSFASGEDMLGVSGGFSW